MMMKQIKLFLIPQPGAKREFLAELALVNPPSVASASAVTDRQQQQQQQQQQQIIWNQQLPGEIVLEAYTRESWAWRKQQPHSVAAAAAEHSSGGWTTTLTVQSVDGRNKLPGFLDYLKQRQKSAYGRFAPTGIFVVSYVQQSTTYTSKSSDGDGAATARQPAQMTCRIALDLTKIPKCNLKPLRDNNNNSRSSSHAKQPHKPQSIVAAASSSAPAAAAAATATRVGGFLGKLVGAQQRTNQHVVAARTKLAGAAAAVTSETTTITGTNADDDDNLITTSTTTAATTIPSPPTALRTSQQVLAEFRQAMQDKMLDFDLHEHEQEMKIELSLSDYTAGLSAQDKAQQRVTMEILKYIVYEAAEEVNEEWIAYKEPSEFMDEVTIAIYKEGAAPPEVLEEINKGELPDEVRGQQRALQEVRHRQANQAEIRKKQQVELEVHRNLDEEADAEEFSILNTNKRDRRTIEDYERERRGDASKRPRT